MPIFNMTGGGASLKCETGTIYIRDYIFKVNTTLKKITHYSFICTNMDYEMQYLAVSDGKAWHNDSDGAEYSNNYVKSTSLKNGVFTVTLDKDDSTGYYYYYILIGE